MLSLGNPFKRYIQSYYTINHNDVTVLNANQSLKTSYKPCEIKSFGQWVPTISLLKKQRRSHVDLPTKSGGDYLVANVVLGVKFTLLSIPD